MYCSHCGSSMPESLNYCNNCGARNERNALIVGNNSAKPMAVAAVLIGGFGLFGFYPIMRELLLSRLDPAVIVILMVAYLGAVVLMFSVLVDTSGKIPGKFVSRALREPIRINRPHHSAPSIRPSSRNQERSRRA